MSNVTNKKAKKITENETQAARLVLFLDRFCGATIKCVPETLRDPASCVSIFFDGDYLIVVNMSVDILVCISPFYFFVCFFTTKRKKLEKELNFSLNFISVGPV